MPEFVKVLRRRDLPEGEGKRVDIGGVAIALFNVGGEIYAIDNACQHQGGALSEGELDGKVITCPLHQWQFNVTTGKNDLDPNIRVPSYPVKVEGGWILVGI